MAPTFDFSKGIPNIVPARTLDVFNNITEDDDFTDYAGSGDEYQADEDTLSQNVENENDNKINIMDVDTTYGEINDIEEKLLSIEMENDNTLNEYNVFDVLDKKYGLYYNGCNELDIKLHHINVAFKLGYDVLVRNTTMNVFEKIANDFEINFDYISLKENNNVYVLHNKEKKVENIKNNFPKLNKIVENKKINTRRLFKSNILDAKACLLSYKIQLFKYKKIKYNLYNNIKDFHNIYDKHKKSYKELMDSFDAVLKEINDEEKEEQLKNLCEKLKQNNKKKINEDNNICKLMFKLENQKVEKLYILADIGEEINKKNIVDEKQFLQQVKKNEDLYYIYDLKSKNKTSRFINMCNKLYILKNKINLGNIISNNLLTFIRDMPKNDFTYLLSLF